MREEKRGRKQASKEGEKDRKRKKNRKRESTGKEQSEPTPVITAGATHARPGKHR